MSDAASTAELFDKPKPIDRTTEAVEKGIIHNGDVLLEHPGQGVELKRGVGSIFIPQSDLEMCDRIGADIRAEAEAARAAGKVECAYCGEWFLPRSSSGGRPQKFCRTECRREADAERKANAPNARQREAQRAENPVPEPLTNEFAPAIPERADDSGFDWISDAADVVLPEQQAVAIYENGRGDIVIRQQQSWCDDQDHIVCVRRENLRPLIDRLCDLAGVLSVGK